MREHPFHRYAAFTNLDALLEASGKPLRKCLRVNTLKTSVEKVRAWAAEKKWELLPVPWCSEGFFVDREDRSEALGKDLLHLLGHVYLQEASSMLPVSMLDPKPGEAILDMSAAPGSKTTQMSALMGNTGVVVANDVQEKRLWTLKTAQHRLGCSNVVVTKKVGQWFAKHMTERFDRVLCDAPCTAQGTVRKDSDALNFCGLENIEKMARLQTELLEAAIHACKVGGRVVYSTCTLTPEENEGVVLAMLRKYPEQLSVRSPLAEGSKNFAQAVADSHLVQAWLEKNGTGMAERQDMLRIWPQTYDSEGFFCAILEKRAPTRQVLPMEWVHFQETPLLRHRQAEIAKKFTAEYGTSFLAEGDALCERESQLLLTRQEVIDFPLPVQNYALGVPFAKGVKEGKLRICSELAILRGHWATQNTVTLSDSELQELWSGSDIECNPDIAGDQVLLWRDIPVGWSLAQKGMLKNRLSRWMVGHKS